MPLSSAQELIDLSEETRERLREGLLAQGLSEESVEAFLRVIDRLKADAVGRGALLKVEVR